MIALKRILVPQDFSETSEAAVKYAVALATTFGAKLHLLHVSEKARTDMATEFPLGLDESVEEAIRERLLKIVTPQEQKELKPEFELRRGRPYAEIVRYARERDIDLIVMGTHGRGFVAHVVMGSVAEKVVRNAPCPVLTVHTPEHEFVIAEELKHRGSRLVATGLLCPVGARWERACVEQRHSSAGRPTGSASSFRRTEQATKETAHVPV